MVRHAGQLIVPECQRLCCVLLQGFFFNRLTLQVNSLQSFEMSVTISGQQGITLQKI